MLTAYPDGGSINTDDLRDVHSGLEFFIPQVLREPYPEWEYESLDGFYPVIARKTGENELELFGQCILISDQALTPIHLRVKAHAVRDEIVLLECKLGELGENGVQRTPYEQFDHAMKHVYMLADRIDTIDWIYEVRLERG